MARVCCFIALQRIDASIGVLVQCCLSAAGRDTRRSRPGTDALSGAEREELSRLRRQLRQVQMERDILAKATAWFAAKSDKTFTPSSNS
jgi:transposase